MADSTTLGLPAELAQPGSFLRTVLALSLTAVAVLRPLYGPDGTSITDFAWVYLNPAGQRMLGQPECPEASLLTLFPTAQADGVFDKCRRAFGTGERQPNETSYTADGLDGYFGLVAQRHDDLLLINFTVTNGQPRPAGEVALRESQAREQQARAQAEAQRRRFYDVLQQLPAQVAIYTGPDHVCSFVNQRFTTYVPAAAMLGRPVREAAAGALREEVLALYDQVYQTGEVAQAREVEAQLTAYRPDEPSVFLDTSYHPLRDADGNIYGVLDFSYDVTPQVRARQQVEQLNQALAARTQEAGQAQAAAEREQAQLQALLTQAPVAIALFQGEEVRVATVNERMAALWGRTPAQVLGQPLVAAVPELRGQGFDEIIRQVQASRVPYVGTEAPATILQDGELVVRYYDFSCQPIYGAQGELLGVLNVGAEVTGQVEARRTLERLNQELETRVQARTRELASQRALLGQLLGQVPAAIATLHGPEHRFSFANARYQHLVGNRVKMGQAVAEALPEVVEQGVIELLDRVYQTGEPFIGQGVMIMLEQPPGPPHQYYYDLTYAPLHDEQGRVQGILVFAVEVTEQVRARRQTALLQAELLQATERRAQERQNMLHVFANAPLAVALLREPDHQLDYWNALLDQYFPGAERGVPVEKGLPALATPEVLAQLDRLYKNGETYQSAPTLLPGATPGAALRYVIFTYQAYRENGRITGVALFLQDVTEQVLGRQQVQHLNEELTSTNQELLHSNARLTSTNADLDTFIYTASHDLKAPITNIEGLITALRQELAEAQLATPDVAYLLQLMDGSVARFQETIGQLMSIVQLQQAGTRGQEQTNLARMIDDVQLDLAGSLAATQAQVLVEVAACPTLRLSPKDLRSIVYNLLSNALKYRSPDRPPVVQIRATCNAEVAELRMQDNGLGLSKPQQARLFQLFQRLHQHVEGSGVGLYAIKKLIENAGGTIRVESEEGVGSTFIVRLPA